MNVKPLVLCLLALVSALAEAQEARTTQWANLRAGPASDYPLVASLGPGTPLAVQGCTEGYGWCDVVIHRNLRGWVYAGYIAYPYRNGEVTVLHYGPAIGLPIVTFSIAPYWDRYYRNRPWYGDEDRWIHHPPPPRPVVRPPPPPRPDQRPLPRPDQRPPPRPDLRPPPPPDLQPSPRPDLRPLPRPLPPGATPPGGNPPPGGGGGRPPGGGGRPPGGGGGGGGGGGSGGADGGGLSPGMALPGSNPPPGGGRAPGGGERAEPVRAEPR